MARLEPVWKAIVAAAADLESGHRLSQQLTAIGQALEARGFAARIRSRLEEQLIPLERRYAADFKRLNLEWLERYFRVEPSTRKCSRGRARYCARGRHIVYVGAQR
jgi:ATP phosphoribosyltransferase regulatory subunit HisZ